ncbi:hypothetical protein HY988_01825 [Candidatus Micrarchaeota archaeon]|nr:hypothetical protein [Candidatus Micrarchaeota archaeon]
MVTKQIERPEEVVTPQIIPKLVEQEQVSKLSGLRISKVAENVVRDLSAQAKDLTPKEAASKAVCNAAFTGMFENMDPKTKLFCEKLELYSIINPPR